MFEVVDHFTGTTSIHATRAEALAAGRLLARRLAEMRGLGAIVEEHNSCDVLICGTVLDDSGEAIDLEPLVWIDPAVASEPHGAGHRARLSVRGASGTAELLNRLIRSEPIPPEARTLRLEVIFRRAASTAPPRRLRS
jgi:hypothetical protein